MNGNAIENCPSFVTGLSIEGNKIYWKIDDKNQLLLAIGDYLTTKTVGDILELAVEVDPQGGLTDTGQGLGVDSSAFQTKITESNKLD